MIALALICLPASYFFVLQAGNRGQEYRVDLEAENQVRFLSDAPLEDFEGRTSRIDGFVFLEGEGLGGDTDLTRSRLFFEVDLASLDTGIGLRNRHMRENYLDTRHFPFASLAGRVVEVVEGKDGRFRVVAEGELTIHGVTRPREIECSLEFPGAARGFGVVPASNLRVGCSFSVILSDHDIPIPKLMFMKISEVVDLELNLTLSPVGS